MQPMFGKFDRNQLESASFNAHPLLCPSLNRKQKIAKAYEVLMNSTKREEFDHILDHPDAYWAKYGSFIVMKYAHESDVRLVLVGLLLVWCLLAYAFQAHNHERTVKLIRHAAENNLGITQGGNATVSVVLAVSTVFV
jgi:hypothetical protein